MGDIPAADDATSTTDDGAPNAKKPKVDVPGSSSQSQPKSGERVGSRNFSQDGRRKGTLTLTIDDWGAFKRSTEKLYSESLALAGVEWKAQANVRNGLIVVSLHASHPTNKANWIRKAECVLRWPRRPQSEYAPHSVLLWNQVPVGIESNFLAHVERTGVVDNKLELSLDVTTFHCYVSEGAFGIQSRFHDVTIVVDKRRILSNKGFLAANAEFFEAKFFGDFEQVNKDEVILDDMKASDFRLFLIAIAPGPPSIMSHQVLSLLRMADRFQAHKLAERCIEFILQERRVDISFVEQLEIADELNMNHFRDLLIEYASVEKLSEAAAAENEEKFTKQTWMKLFLKYKQFKPT